MRRRELITLLGGATASSFLWPLLASAQQPAPHLIGYLHSGSPQSTAPLLAAFHDGLRETGHVEGQNLAVEYRWARDDLSRLPEMAADLVGRRVAVIATPGSTAATWTPTAYLPVEMSGVWATYGRGAVALKDVSLRVAPGERVALRAACAQWTVPRGFNGARSDAQTR